MQTENLLCLHAAYVLRQKHAAGATALALLEDTRRYFGTYVAMDAVNQVNVSSQVREKFTRKLPTNICALKAEFRHTFTGKLQAATDADPLNVTGDQMLMWVELITQVCATCFG